MIVGAEEAASIVIKEMNSNWQTDREIVLAVDDNKGKQGAHLHGIPVKGDMDQIPELVNQYQIEDLLGREEIVLSNEKLKTIIKDQVVLVTGGGGSIGSKLCRQIVNLSPRLLVVVDIYENNAYDLQMELIQNGVPKERIKMLIASVRDKKKLKEIFEVYRPDLVFHAAAHKHVPLMEDSPSEAVKNNVYGTLNVAQCAAAYKVKESH